MHRSVEENPSLKSTSSEQPMNRVYSAETIAAISTPAGEGAIALVRISGPDAVRIADTIFRGKEKPSQFASHVQHLGEIVNAAGELVDQVMISVHRAPSSYTGEDVVEVACHGGTLVTAKVLETCLRAGARAARPGEFTERAFHNGKMDLTQAEAVIDLIRARSDLALRSATEQLEGKLGQKIAEIRQSMIDLLAHIEASVDFSEEGISPDKDEQLRQRIESTSAEIRALLATADYGRLLRDGVRIVIYGATNAGKSSLLNRLLGYERVIVSETHGTTRDTIEEAMNLQGIPVRLLDTAGLRASTSHVEREGIARTERSLQTADLRLHVLDRNAPPPPHFGQQGTNGNDLLVLNKSDLSEHAAWRDTEAVRLSCLTGEGMVELEKAILSRIGKQNLRPENSFAINMRHRDCLRRALEACARAATALDQKLSAEYLSVDLNEALAAVGEVIGTTDVEQILDSVFGQFCIGK
jgi:tRNA modification GTPase